MPSVSNDRAISARSLHRTHCQFLCQLSKKSGACDRVQPPLLAIAAETDYCQGRMREEGMQQLASKNCISERWNLLEKYSKIDCRRV